MLASLVSELSSEQSEAVHTWTLEHLKHADTELIQLIVALLASPVGEKVVASVGRLM